MSFSPPSYLCFLKEKRPVKGALVGGYSTVTLFARFLGLSTEQPFCTAR